MAHRSTGSRRKTTLHCAAAIVAVAFVCASGPALAQESKQETKWGEDPITTMMKWRPTAPPKEMPDFVKKTRPAEGQMDFTPLTGQEPNRRKPKTAEEVAREMKRFDAAASANKAKAARAFGAARPAARPPAKRAAVQ